MVRQSSSSRWSASVCDTASPHAISHEKMVILPLRKLGFAILPSRKWDSPVCHSQTIHTRKYALWRICCQIIIFLLRHLFLPVLPLSLIPSFLFIHRIFMGERARRERERDETKTNRGNCSTAADGADGRQQPTSSALSFPATASALGRRRFRARPPRRVRARTPPPPRR